MTRWLLIGLAALVAAVSFGVLPSRPLFNPDEGRYAEIPREMLAGGDWVIPHLNGLDYVEKPPLQYWATAGLYRVLGVSPFSARLYTALCAWGLIGMVWLLARRVWGEEAAWRAGAVLASFALFAILGQLLTLDMSLTFYMTLSLAGFLVAQTQGSAPGAKASAGRAFMWLAWAAAAGGVLTKGLVAAAIPAAVLVLYTVRTRDWAVWRRLQLIPGLVLFLLLTVPWHWLAAGRLPDFLEFFFVHEHLNRYLTPTADRQEVWWFFGAVFAAGSLPWTVSGLRVLATGWRRTAPAGAFDVRVFLWLWIVFVIVFFSLSDSKLIPYILPALPALALLIGASSARELRREVMITAIVVLVVATVLIAARVLLPGLLHPSERSPYFLQLREPLVPVTLVMMAAVLIVLLRFRREPTAAAVFLGSGWCVGMVLLMRAAAVVAPIYSGASLAAAMPEAGRAATLYSVGTYDQTLPFYLARTVQLVEYRGELDFGLRHAPADASLGLEEFLRRWSAEPSAYAVMEWDLFDQLQSRGVPMREVHRDLQRVLVARQ